MNSDISRNALNAIATLGCSVKFVHMKYDTRFTCFLYLNILLVTNMQLFMLRPVKDNIIMHFVLSRVNFQRLYTFVDGTVNIFPDSIYYREPNIGCLAKIWRILAGVRYDMEDIKRLSALHYTIYDGYKNIIGAVSLIRLVPPSCAMPKSGNMQEARADECNVMLGTIYSGIFVARTDIAARHVDACVQVLEQSGRLTYYIPHPREHRITFNANWQVIAATHMAEEEDPGVTRALSVCTCLRFYEFLSV